jgi:hypothetical protein
MPVSELDRKPRSGLVMEQAARVEARRMALAEQFRARLDAEALGSGIAREALIDSAVSCYVEISELSTRFMRGRASEKDQQRLGLARGQLYRLLRALGLVACAPDDGGPSAPNGTGAESLADWARSAKTAASAISSDPSAPSAPVVAGQE